MTVQAVASIQTDPSAMRRGACPTLGRPMRTGDGLLARLRPLDCRMTAAQLRAVAQSAATFGNGILEVTARGSLQVRGLREETVADFEQSVLESGIVPATGLMVEVPPLAGIDRSALVDPSPVAADIRRIAAASRLELAPKLAVVVDGGGRFHLGGVIADIRLTAVGPDRFLLAVGGDGGSARKIAIVPVESAAAAAGRVLQAIASLGPAARGRDVTPVMLGDLFDLAAAAVQVPLQAASFLGVQRLGPGSPAGEDWMLGIALAYRQVHAADMIGFLADVKAGGVCDIHLSPNHGLILAGLTEIQAVCAEAAARRRGFWTAPEEPRAAISLCAGISGCASAFFDTKAAAETIARHAPELLDGAVTIHLSGCPKGCAHPAAAPLTLVGAPCGYGLVVNGAAPHQVSHYIAANDLGIALERLASLVAGAKEAGETVSGCIRRLGGPAIAGVLMAAD